MIDLDGGSRDADHKPQASIRLYESEWEAADEVAEIVGTTPTRN